MREKLIEIIQSAVACPKRLAVLIADAIIENGVIVLPCKVGDTVWALYSTTEYKTRTGRRRRENCLIRNDHHLSWALERSAVEIREKKLAKSELPKIGKFIFVTREEAEAALKEVQG